MFPINDFIGECEVCRVPAVLRCTGCGIVRYCNRKHQKEDWEVHQTHCLVNEVWQIRTSPEVGRYIVALRDIKKGEFIMTEVPFVTGPRSFQLPIRPCLQPCCVGCCMKLNPGAPAFCPNCKWPICSNNCQRVTDENYHGKECFLLKFLLQTEKFPPWTAVLPLRCLLLQKLNPQKWKFLLEMAMYTVAKVVNRCKDDILVRVLFSILLPLKIIAPESLPDFSPMTLKQVLSVLDVYGVSWSPGEDVELASLYPAISFVQHSCVPNTHLYYGPLLPKSAVYVRRSHYRAGAVTIQAIKDISKDEVLTTSWISVVYPTITRQFQLKYKKNMQCYCERCLDPRELGSDFGTMKCLACSGAMVPLYPRWIFVSDWSCQKCRLSFPSSEVYSRASSVLAEYNDLKGDATVDILESLLTKLQKSFHPNHFICFKVKLKLLKAYGALKIMSDKDPSRIIELCRSVQDVKKKLGTFFVLEEIVDHAECYLQLARAQIELTKRAFHDKSWDADHINRSIKKSRALLLKAQDLWDEPPLIPDHVNVASRIQTEIVDLKKIEEEMSA